jgi:hypothetical protein
MKREYLSGLEKSAYSIYECVFHISSLRDTNTFFSSFGSDINAKIPAAIQRIVSANG